MKLYGAYIYSEISISRFYLICFEDFSLVQVKRYLYNGQIYIHMKPVSKLYSSLLVRNKFLNLRPVKSLKKYYNEK